MTTPKGVGACFICGGVLIASMVLRLLVGSEGFGAPSEPEIWLLRLSNVFAGA